MVEEELLIAAPAGLKPHQRVNDGRKDLIKQLWVAKPLPWVLVEVRKPAVWGFHQPIRTCGLDHCSNHLDDSRISLAAIEVDHIVILGKRPSEPVLELLT